MSTRVYDLEIGESFAVYGSINLNGLVFTVESVIHDMAVCVSQDAASRLIMPLNVGMPFAVQVFHTKKKAAEQPEKIQAKKDSAQEDSKEESEPKRICSTIDFFMPQENWGKIRADGLAKGIFFHVTQVEDDTLRKYLATLPMGTRIPKIKVSYQKCRNTGRNNALCAGAIRLEEPLEDCKAEQAEPDAPRDGYLMEMACNGTLTILDCETSREFRTNHRTAVDPFLKAYLDHHVGFGNLDNQDIKVLYSTLGKNLVRVEWRNREEILTAKSITLDEETVDPAALEKWNGTEPEENGNTDRPVPPYQPLPAWKSSLCG